MIPVTEYPKKSHRDKIRKRLAMAVSLLVQDPQRTRKLLIRLGVPATEVHDRLAQLQTLLLTDIPVLLDVFDATLTARAETPR